HDGHAGREVSHGVAEASFVRRGAAPTLTLPRRGRGFRTHARKVTEADSRYTGEVRLVQSEFYEILHPLGIWHPRHGSPWPQLRHRPGRPGRTRRAGGPAALVPRADSRAASPRRPRHEPDER